MKVTLQQRELNAVNREDFHWGDKQIAYSVLFDLEDGEEVISVEVCQNVNTETYLAHLITMNKKYNIRIATNGRGLTMPEAITKAFVLAKVMVRPTLADLSSSNNDVYRVTPVMEAIAQELGVKRYKIFSAGSQPLK